MAPISLARVPIGCNQGFSGGYGPASVWLKSHRLGSCPMSEAEAALPFEAVDFDSIPVVVDDSFEFPATSSTSSRATRATVQQRADRSRSLGRSSPTGQSLERQAQSRFTSTRHLISTSPSGGVCIKIDDDLEMIVSDLQATRPRARARAMPIRAVRPDLPALYLETFHFSRSEHCIACHQTFGAGDLRVGFIMEPNLVPHWVHLSCSRRARLQCVGRLLACDPAVTVVDRDKALKELGRSGRNAREVQPWNYLRAIVHQWTSELVYATVEDQGQSGQEMEKEIAEILSSLPCEQLDASRDICAICHQTMAEGEIVCNLPCGHFYHVGCIDAWLRIRTTCPLDNREIRPKQLLTSRYFKPIA